MTIQRGAAFSLAYKDGRTAGVETLEVRDGTIPQGLTVYEFFEALFGSPSYSRIRVGFEKSIGRFLIVTEAGPFAGARDLEIKSAGNLRFNTAVSNAQVLFEISDSGELAISPGSLYGSEPEGTLVPARVDNGIDIGVIGIRRYRQLIVGTALVHAGANGQSLQILEKDELTAVGNGVLTQASTITIPTNAVVLAVSSRVVTQPGGTTTYSLAGTTSTTQFSTSAAVSTVAGTTDPGTKNCPFYDAQVNETVTYTFNAGTTNALGQIRTTIYYYLSTPPTS